MESANPAEPPIPDDCVACGVCCFSGLEAYVRVSGSDWERLGADAPRLAHFIGNQAFMRMEQCHCIALDERRVEAGAGGKSESRQYFCLFYEKRPTICREFERGSPRCRGELWAKSQAFRD